MARWEALARDSSAYLEKLVESGTDWANLWGSAESSRFVRWRVRMGACYVEAFRANGLSSAGTQVGTPPDEALPSHSLCCAACAWHESRSSPVPR